MRCLVGLQWQYSNTKFQESRLAGSKVFESLIETFCRYTNCTPPQGTPVVSRDSFGNPGLDTESDCKYHCTIHSQVPHREKTLVRYGSNTN
jgi:hypothetical protein